MPSTVNGIGTHYYGKSDASSRSGVCRSCGAHTNLQTYTTRLWFVVLFIPIIPLKRVRLLDYCPCCSRHWVANPEQYEMSRQLAVSGAMEKYRDQPSVDAALGVHAQLLAFHMHTEADQFRQTALKQFADSAELRAGLGSHLDQTGRWMEATPLYEQAFELRPDLPDVRVSLAWRRQNQNELDDAYELLDFLRQPGAGQSFNLAQLDSLGKAYQRTGNHERALEIFEHLLREAPDLGDQFEFRKVVSKSETALHRSSSMLPTKSFSVRGLFDSKSGTHAPWVRWAAFSSIAIVLFAIGMLGMNEYRRTHRWLYVVNGFAQPVTVSIDGGPAVPVPQRHPFPVSEGKHTLNVTGPVTRQSEIVIHTGYWSRWTYSPTWVFNIEKAAPVVMTNIFYAVVPVPSQSRWLNDEEFNFIPHVDYLFKQPPQTLELGNKNQTISKIRVDMTTIPTSTTFISLQADRPGVALTFAEGFLEQNRNDSALLNLYASQAKEDAGERRVTEFLKKSLWRKPISIPWHRTYQNQESVATKEDELAAEYDTQLQQSPDDAALLYLRGRVGPNRADQLKHYRLAIEKNPQLGWPSLALAYEAANRGEWREARDLCDKAANVLRADPSFRGLWHIVRLANGEAATIETECRQQLHGQDYSEVVAAFYFLIDALAVQQKNDQVGLAAREWLARMAGPAAAPELMSSFDPMVDYLCGNVASIRKRQEKAVTKGQSGAHIQGLLAIGEPDVALKIEGIDDVCDEWSGMLAVSLSYSLAGNAAEADTWRGRACDKLREGNKDYQRGAALLQQDAAPSDDELAEVVLRINETALLMASLAQRFPDQRAAFNQRAERLNVSRLPPYLLVKRAVEQP